MILQKYDFSSKSQLGVKHSQKPPSCLWYCKSTIFQANHNGVECHCAQYYVVCDTAKVRFFKQITTLLSMRVLAVLLFVILQKYDFSSKSQHKSYLIFRLMSCLWYCKSTIFQANHNRSLVTLQRARVVCDTAKVRFFKQITTNTSENLMAGLLFVILQKYDFSSKSQHLGSRNPVIGVVCDTAKVRFFKQITTYSE